MVTELFSKSVCAQQKESDVKERYESGSGKTLSGFLRRVWAVMSQVEADTGRQFKTSLDSIKSTSATICLPTNFTTDIIRLN